MQTTDRTEKTAERELVITRLLDAPRELVFRAWTEPEHLIHWWGPNGFTNTFHAIDVTPGGVWHFTMHAPDGKDYPNRVVFEEITEPERITYRHGSGEEGEEGEFHVTVTFEEEERKTRLTLRMLFASAEVRAHMIRFGAVEGGNQTLGRLERHLKGMA